MVEIKFVDAQAGIVDIASFDDGVPNAVHDMKLDFGGNLSNLTSLANMMNKTTRKLNSIAIENVDRISPEFLVLFASLSNKTSKLRLHRCWLSEAFYGCLIGCIMNGLVSLDIENPHGLQFVPSAYQTKLLFEAVSSSTSLERLELDAPIVVHDDICSSIVRALQRNRSLRALQLHVHGISAAQDILRTILWETKLREVAVTESMTNEKLVPLSSLIDGLCREDCTVKKIDLTFRFDMDVDLDTVSTPNTSLVEIFLRHSNLTCHQAVKIVKVCKSAQVLNMSENPISDLAPLDELLLGETAILQRLYIYNKGISEEKWIEFFEKIPRMKSLERLALTTEVFVKYSDSLRTALLDALWQNSVLESCKIYDDNDPELTNLDEKVFLSKVSIPVCLNRAGRNALRNSPSGQPLLKGLWPLILERAMKLKYYSVVDPWNSPSLTSTRTDAVYWLLRENLFV